MKKIRVCLFKDSLKEYFFLRTLHCDCNHHLFFLLVVVFWCVCVCQCRGPHFVMKWYIYSGQWVGLWSCCFANWHDSERRNVLIFFIGTCDKWGFLSTVFTVLAQCRCIIASVFVCIYDVQLNSGYLQMFNFKLLASSTIRKILLATMVWNHTVWIKWPNDQIHYFEGILWILWCCFWAQFIVSIATNNFKSSFCC